ncbi:uncharacterized protein CTRU02_203069 [Colletotrichum truncatum]|uniref:Uncharacterized protein n=1 Tax=Colletotrichum truncatum TaxID=5467 RepID=A0ACC3Z883_COLTU
MRSTKPYALLALAGLGSSQLIELSNCPILGPAYPALKDLRKSRVIRDTGDSFTKIIEEAVATGETEWGLIGTANTSFSLSVFSADSDDYLFEYHHRGTELDGSLTGDVLNADTLYRIGSVSKLFTVYTLLIKLDPSYWSQPITNFIPELADAPTNNGARQVQWSDVTLGALMSHMGGLARNNGFTDISGVPGVESIGLPRLDDSSITKCGLPGKPACTREESIRLLLQQNPATGTWTTPVYSNEAFQLLGWAYENITGETMEQGFNSAIVKPLGLSRTFWNPPENDPNANVVDPEPSLESLLVGYKFEEGLGSYTPTGGIYASPGDLSTIGRSILRSSLLSEAQTREWLKPVTFTASTHTAIGKAWEISRMEVPVTPGSDRTRLVDLYAKSGGISSYLTYLILSPDHRLGVTINIASKNAFGGAASDPSFGTLTNLLLDKWIPAAEDASREAAGNNLAGTYISDDGTDSVIELALVPGRLGLAVQKLLYNGTDFLTNVGGTLGFQGADLQYVGLRDDKDVVFQAIFSSPLPKVPRRPSPLNPECSGVWSARGFFTYGNVMLDEVIISVDKEDKGIAVELPALRTKFVKKVESDDRQQFVFGPH